MNWVPITKPPEKSQYVLLACYHHKIPKVIYGFCKIHRDGTVIFKEEIYHGGGLTITHWMPLPEHPTKGEG